MNMIRGTMKFESYVIDNIIHNGINICHIQSKLDIFLIFMMF